MKLDRLNHWRMLRGYSIRELAMLCDLDPSTIWKLEKHGRPAYGSTARKLAEVLAVEVNDLFTTPIEPDVLEETHKKPTLEKIKPDRTAIRTRAAKSQPPAGDCWVIDFDGDTFGPFNQADADRLQVKLGGKHKARVYQAAKKAEAWDQHRPFLVKVARGHDSW